MHEVMAVSALERAGDLDAARHRLLDGQRPGRDPLRERLPVEKFHDQEVDLSVPADVEHGADVRMVQAGRGAGFPLEALTRRPVVADRALEDFDRHRPAEPRITRPIHFPHRARTHTRDDLVRTQRRPGLE